MVTPAAIPPDRGEASLGRASVLEEIPDGIAVDPDSIASYDTYIMYKQPEPRRASVTVSQARQTFAELVNRAAYGNERITVARHGREVVAIVPMSDVRLLEAIEADPVGGVRASAPAEERKAPRRPASTPRP
jgi:prevent-host-death family protein